MAKTKAFRDGFMDFIRKLEGKGKAGSYLARFKKVLNFWLAYNGLNVKLKVNIAGESDNPTIANERIPSKGELEKIVRMATPRAGASISLMAFSGLRPESLEIDLVEAEINNGMDFARIPAMLVVRKVLSKARHRYFTLVPKQEITYIKEYLERGLSMEKISIKILLLWSSTCAELRKKVLRTTLVTRDIKEAILKLDLNGDRMFWNLLRYKHDNSRIQGKDPHPCLQFMMGHKGGIEARYSTNKGALHPDMIEDMRESCS